MWERRSTVEHLPADPVGEAMAASIVETLGGATVEVLYSPSADPPPPVPDEAGAATATGEGPPGWRTTLTVRLGRRVVPLVTEGGSPLLALLGGLPGAALRAATVLRPSVTAADGAALSPPLRRALRDSIAAELLAAHEATGVERPLPTELIAETLEFLIELSGTRVESQDLTHGVVITDVLPHPPRLELPYPSALRDAKRAPLLFDGQQSVLVVDRDGRARTELQRHRLSRLMPDAEPSDAYAFQFAHGGWFVAEASRLLGGIGFFLRADRTIWAFADGQPLLMRRAEHWSAVPLELTGAIASAIGGHAATAAIVVQAALIISAQRHGAILAIVGDAGSLAGIVSPKDRYDLRNDFDPTAMQVETRIHHLIDANAVEALDAQTLARLAALDGATVLDRDGRLLAYGAVVTSSDSQHEGARTAAAKTLSLTAEIVLKVSADGDITVFRDGEVVATILR
jgi:hypothetical protein